MGPSSFAFRVFLLKFAKAFLVPEVSGDYFRAHQTHPASNSIAVLANSSEIEIRLIQTYDEYIAVADLQRIGWGQESIEIVPPSILMVNQKRTGMSISAG